VANNERLRMSDLVIATWNDVALWVGSGKADEQQIAVLHETLDRLSDSPGLMLWLPHRAAAPEGKARTRAGRLFREMGARLQGFALIAEGGGFWASAIRSIVTGLSLAARTRFPFKAMPAIEEAAPWLMDKMGRPEEADALLSHASKLRNSLEQWDPPL
jgi:hypothetical protein